MTFFFLILHKHTNVVGGGAHTHTYIEKIEQRQKDIVFQKFERIHFDAAFDFRATVS